MFYMIWLCFVVVVVAVTNKIVTTMEKKSYFDEYDAKGAVSSSIEKTE